VQITASRKRNAGWAQSRLAESLLRAKLSTPSKP
jgi:hypothetical protein